MDMGVSDTMVVEEELVTAAEVEQVTRPLCWLVVAAQLPPVYRQVMVSGWHSEGDEHEVTLVELVGSGVGVVAASAHVEEEDDDEEEEACAVVA